MLLTFQSQQKIFPKAGIFKNLPWTYTAWARHFNRWTQGAFFILAINKCECSQWQMQCIFSLCWDSSLVFISTFCQTFFLDTKPTCEPEHAGTQSWALSSLTFLFHSKVCKHSHCSDCLPGVSVLPPCLISLPALTNVLITGITQWL